ALAALAALLAAPAAAQVEYAPALLVGDAVPGVGLVTAVTDLDVASSGAWVVSANTDYPDDFANSVVVRDGLLVYREGMTLLDPADHGVNSFGQVYLSPAGEVATTLYVWPMLGGLNFELVHVAGKELLRVGDLPLGPFLPNSYTFVAFDEARQNAQGHVLVHATFDDAFGAQFVEALVRYTLDANGNPLGELPIAVEGDTVFGVGGQELIEDLVGGPNQHAFTDTGLAMYQVNLTGPAATEIAILVSGNLVAQEGGFSGVPDRPWSNLMFMPADLNDAGHYVVVGEIAGDAATKHLIALDGQKYVQSGDPVPGVPGATILNFGQTTPVFVDDQERVLWSATWLDGGLRKGLFLGALPIAIEGETEVLGATVTSLFTFQDGFALAPDGATVLFRATLSDGRSGAFLATLPGEVAAVPGCFGNPGVLSTTSAPPGIGEAFTVDLGGNPYASAFGGLYAAGAPAL
ncbi:MAG TPA: hypothetical protein VJP77_09235, partial [Planctomycetota bacterium]|nr:hypothetical protein [Planctomycetota bacterium]